MWSVLMLATMYTTWLITDWCGVCNELLVKFSSLVKLWCFELRVWKLHTALFIVVCKKWEKILILFGYDELNQKLLRNVNK